MMNVTTFKTYLILLISLAVASGIFSIYMAAYRKRLNAALNSGVKVKKSSFGPPWMVALILVMIVLCIALVTLIIGSLFKGKGEFGITGDSGFDSTAGGIISTGDPKIRNYSAKAVETTLIGDYAPGEDIKGYTKYEYTDGDIRFIYYTDSSDCSIMPPLLIYAEYTGGNTVSVSDGSLHIDNTNWDGKTYDLDGWITDGNCVWYKVENFFTTGTMTMTHTVDFTDSDDKVTGTLTIDVEKAFGINVDENGESFTTSTAD